MSVIKVDARGEACPIPVIKTRQAIAELQGPGTVETLVSEEIAVQNISKLAAQKGYGLAWEKQGESEYRIILTVEQAEPSADDTFSAACNPAASGRTVVAVGADHMGEGDPKLGKSLMKAFLFAVSQQEELPATILFYNGGASLTCEGSDSLDDLKNMEALGVEILTCGTCLNFYGLTDKLAVGNVTNMYEIVEKQVSAGRIVRP